MTIPLGLENFGQLTIPRQGVMVHYDASSSDAGALQWFRDPAFRFSYNRVFLDDGRRVNLVAAPGDRSSFHRAAYHAGVCRTQETPYPVHSANQAFYGLAITAAGGDVVKPPQYQALLEDVVAIFRVHRWPAREAATRIVGHDEWAIFNRSDNPGHR
jgi:N-acetyl-anhydromuramyl-L-alanine amidase AmpD